MDAGRLIRPHPRVIMEISGALLGVKAPQESADFHINSRCVHAYEDLLLFSQLNGVYKAFITPPLPASDPC